MKRLLLLLTALALVAVALGARCAQDESGRLPQSVSTTQTPDSQPTHLPTFFPTPGPTFPWESGVFGGVADDAQEAAGFARDVLTSPPPLVMNELQSLQYVEITTQDGKELLDPTGDTVWDAPDGVPALLFVARGRFVFVNRFSVTPAPEFSTYCIVVPIGEAGTFSAQCEDDLDASEFGQVHDVPLPLPEFPMPVSFSAESSD
jgi:hypothetical protein